jgi:cystathionine beta-lyase/cystathionine gamma-synthase
MKDDYKNRTKEDILIHYGEDSGDFLGAVSVPIFQTSLFSRKRGESGYRYTRVSNPTIEVAEKKLAELEKGEKALLFSSGMAALTASVMRYVKHNGHIACVKHVYSGITGFFTQYLKEKMNVDTTFFEADDFQEFKNSVRENTDIIYLETCVSNVFKIPDIKGISAYAKERGIKVIVDNTYSTPIFCNPIELGADISAHSCSKYISGHSDLIGGAAIGPGSVMDEMQHWERSCYGAAMDPHQAWLLIRGMRTLALRMERHMKSGMEVAGYLEKHPKIKKVIYPALKSHPQHEFSKTIMSGYPGLFCFVPEGGRKQAGRLAELLQLPEKGPSWGGYETLMNIPGSVDSEEEARCRGVMPGQIRISIGLENPETIIMDLEQALDKI